ncbi:MAG: TonB-dependent receptor [Bacteroidia bacterium]|nr:TonB-dependent receptor [Bacteroidia bacterium]
MKHLSLLFIFCALAVFSQPVLAQSGTQNIRGRVVDKESEAPIQSAQIITFKDDGGIIGAYSDDFGFYELKNVPVGYRTVIFSALSYDTVSMRPFITSGSELVLDMSLDPRPITANEVTIEAGREEDVNNEHAASVSQISIAFDPGLQASGTREDPVRQAVISPSVQGADDSRNDLVVRGNSPSGVLYRMEGINIPNPNHFAVPGTGGGPQSLLNNKYLKRADFYTGGFPANYGNGTAAVFDMWMRNGNDSKHEVSLQLGFLGTEASIEGPISKEKRSSYLVTYRYSTLQLFSFMGINVGTSAVPQYQDLGFRFYFPRKKGGYLAFWGIGGMSTIDIILSNEVAPDTSTLIYGANDRDQYFSTNTGMTGVTYVQPIGTRAKFQAGAAVSHQGVLTHHDYISRRVVNNAFVYDSLPPILDYQFQENKIHAYLQYNRTLDANKRHRLQAGINFDYYMMRYQDSARQVITQPAPALGTWRLRWNASTNAPLVQPYVQYRFLANERLSLFAGVTSLYWGLNDNSFSPVEPRLGMDFRANEKHTLSFAASLHSQIQTPYMYFYGFETIDGVPQEVNRDLGLTKSIHLIVGDSWQITPKVRLKAEAYYQYLYDIPVETKISSFSVINAGSGFNRLFPDTLVNGGTGRNMGLEVMLTRRFVDGYYYILSGTLYDSKYRGSDEVWRNTTFNGRYAMTAVGGKGIELGALNSQLVFGASVTYAGGRWYGPVDNEASARELEIIYVDATVNTEQFRPYFRADAKINYRWNRPKVTHEFAIDFVNLFGIQNILTLTYNPNDPGGQNIREEYQLGFLPIFYYKLSL